MVTIDTAIALALQQFKVDRLKAEQKSNFMQETYISSLIKIIPQTQFSYRLGLTGMAYRSSSRDLSIV
jgi:hypothetical protein